MGTILVTGGAGYIGKAFLRNVVRENKYKIYAVFRTKQDETAGITQIVSDVTHVDQFKAQLLDSDFIIWFAALRDHFASEEELFFNNVLPVERVIPILQQSKKLKKFIFISSISVLSDDINRLEPISDLTTAAPSTAYGKSKLKAEQLLQTSGLPCLVLRLPFMYGSGYKPFTHLWLWEKLSNFRLIALRFPAANISLLHVDDLSKILLKILSGNSRIKLGSTLLVADPKVHKVDEILTVLGSGKRSFPVKKTLNCSRFLRVAAPLIWGRKLKYWLPLLFKENYFAVVPSDVQELSEFEFISLTDGLKETFK